MINQQLNQIAAFVEHLQSKGAANVSLIDETFPKQAQFLRDPARLKCALCTRRSGKSYGAAQLMFETARLHPGSSILYIALTRDSAKRIMWKDCIKQINKKHGLGGRANEVSLTLTMPNGSVLYLTGADAKPDEMEKLLGQKYPLVVIDEAASWKQDLRRLVYGILKPAVADYEGTIMMIGTPGNITTGLFFDVTNGKEPGWSVHKWNTFDNPYMADKWRREIEGLKALNPLIVETPLFKQMYLGEWFIDTDKLCYKFSAERNLVKSIPDQDYFYVMGVDLGYDPDPSAFVVWAYAPHDNKAYVVEAFKKNKMIISDVAERIRYFMRKYPLHKVVIDASAKQAVEEMRQRYSLPLEAAEKTGKAGYMDILSSELITGNACVLEGIGDELVNEWSNLVWDESSTRREENPSCANHLADAALYSYRYVYNYCFTPAKPETNIHSVEKVDEFWEKEAERLEQDKDKPFWERM